MVASQRYATWDQFARHTSLVGLIENKFVMSGFMVYTFGAREGLLPT